MLSLWGRSFFKSKRISGRKTLGRFLVLPSQFISSENVNCGTTQYRALQKHKQNKTLPWESFHFAPRERNHFQGSLRSSFSLLTCFVTLYKSCSLWGFMPSAIEMRKAALSHSTINLRAEDFSPHAQFRNLYSVSLKWKLGHFMGNELRSLSSTCFDGHYTSMDCPQRQWNALN